MKSQKVVFENQAGEALAGRLDRPDDSPPRAYVLFAHCFTCSKNLQAVTHISRALCDSGFAVFRFDFTGLGQSGGDFANTNFSSNVDDLIMAARFLGREYQAPKLLIGHSLGGAAVLRAAGALSEVIGVVTIGAPASPDHVKHLLADEEDRILREGQARVVLAGRTFTIKRQFLEDLDAHQMRQHIGKLKKALLVCHAPLDQTVGIDNAAGIFTTAKHPKSFLSLDRADHLLTNPADSSYAGEVIAAWSRRYLI